MGIHAGILSLTILVAIAMVPASSATAQIVMRPRTLPGGVATPDGGTGFVSIPDGGVRVVDLKKGTNLGLIAAEGWLRPLIATDNSVVTVGPPDGSDRGPGQAFAITIVESSGLRVRTRSQGIVLPRWVAPLGRQPRGDWGRQSLRFEARIRGEQLLVLWEASQRSSGGTYPSGARGEPIHQAGEVVILPLHTPGLPVEVTIPMDRLDDATLAAFDRPPARFASLESLEYTRGGASTTAPLFVAGRVVVFGVRPSDGGRTLTLRSWNPADPADEATIDLMTVRADYHPVEVTLDGQHLLVNEEPTDQGAARISRSLFSLATGRFLARFSYEPGMMAGSVLDGNFYYDSLEHSGVGSSASIRRYLKAAGLSADGRLKPLWRLELTSRPALNAAPPPPPSYQRGS
jgi:hypothetical protein